MKPNHNRSITDGDRAIRSGNLSGRKKKLKNYSRKSDKNKAKLLRKINKEPTGPPERKNKWKPRRPS